MVTTATGATIRVGSLPAPVPEPLLPLLHQHLAARANQRTMNHGSRWLFPGTRVGHHITEQTPMHRFRRFGIDIRAVRNTALHN